MWVPTESRHIVWDAAMAFIHMLTLCGCGVRPCMVVGWDQLIPAPESQWLNFQEMGKLTTGPMVAWNQTMAGVKLANTTNHGSLFPTSWCLNIFQCPPLAWWQTRALPVQAEVGSCYWNSISVPGRLTISDVLVSQESNTFILYMM